MAAPAGPTNAKRWELIAEYHPEDDVTRGWCPQVPWLHVRQPGHCVYRIFAILHITLKAKDLLHAGDRVYMNALASDPANDDRTDWLGKAQREAQANG